VKNIVKDEIISSYQIENKHLMFISVNGADCLKVLNTHTFECVDKINIPKIAGLNIQDLLKVK